MKVRRQLYDWKTRRGPFQIARLKNLQQEYNETRRWLKPYWHRTCIKVLDGRFTIDFFFETQKKKFPALLKIFGEPERALDHTRHNFYEANIFTWFCVLYRCYPCLSCQMEDVNFFICYDNMLTLVLLLGTVQLIWKHWLAGSNFEDRSSTII